MAHAPIIEMHHISKQFGEVQANDSVDFILQRGEIHAIVGENGAGKSTLMKILYGLYQPDAGEISVNGNRVDIPSPRRAMRLGLGMVQQHFTLIPVFTALQNHRPRQRTPKIRHTPRLPTSRKTDCRTRRPTRI